MSESLQPAAGPTTTLPDVLYRTVDGIPLYMDIIRPAIVPVQPMPVIVYIHGGGWWRGDRKENRNALLAAQGFFTVSIDYRLSSQAIFPAQLLDAQAAIRWLRIHAVEYHLDPERIGVWGHSAGGHLAALIATAADSAEFRGQEHDVSSKVRCVVDLAGPSDLSKMGDWHDEPDSVESKLIGGPVLESPELVRRANPISFISKDTPPFLIFHGTADTIVRPHQSEMLYVALQAAGCEAELVPVQDEDHTFTVHGEESLQQIYQRTLAFFTHHLSF